MPDTAAARQVRGNEAGAVRCSVAYGAAATWRATVAPRHARDASGCEGRCGDNVSTCYADGRTEGLITSASVSANRAASAGAREAAVTRTPGDDRSRNGSPAATPQPWLARPCTTGTSFATGTHTLNPDAPIAAMPRP